MSDRSRARFVKWASGAPIRLAESVAANWISPKVLSLSTTLYASASLSNQSIATGLIAASVVGAGALWLRRKSSAAQLPAAEMAQMLDLARQNDVGGVLHCLVTSLERRLPRGSRPGAEIWQLDRDWLVARYTAGSSIPLKHLRILHADSAQTRANVSAAIQRWSFVCVSDGFDPQNSEPFVTIKLDGDAGTCYARGVASFPFMASTQTFGLSVTSLRAGVLGHQHKIILDVYAFALSQAMSSPLKAA